MRIVSWQVLALGLLAMVLMLASGDQADAQDRSMTCRPLAARGLVWLECCNQSFARNPTRAITQRARMHNIERCVRNRLRNT